MREFGDYFRVVLKHEGGLGEHPNDPGGITKYGISLLFLKDLPLKDADIDHDGDIDRNDIIALTIDDSKELYKKFFWNPLHLDLLESEMLKLNVFDHGVNAGTKTAIKILQRLLNLEADGILGPMTAKAANDYGETLVDKYKQARKEYYLKIIINNPKLAVFKKGWFNRVETTKF